MTLETRWGLNWVPRAPHEDKEGLTRLPTKSGKHQPGSDRHRVVSRAMPLRPSSPRPVGLHFLLSLRHGKPRYVASREVPSIRYDGNRNAWCSDASLPFRKHAAGADGAQVPLVPTAPTPAPAPAINPRKALSCVRVAFEARKLRSVYATTPCEAVKLALERSHSLAKAPPKLPNRAHSFQIDAISVGCDSVRLGRNFGALGTFTKRLNLAAKAHVQDSDVVSVDSEAWSRTRKLGQIPFARSLRRASLIK